MFGRLFYILAILAAVPFSAFSDSVYVNNGIVTNQQVDATAFINYGEFYQQNLSVPWTSLNTKVYTNRGIMSASLGFNLQTVSPPFGFRTAADTFVNARTGKIQSFDANGSLVFGGISGFFFTPDTSYFTVVANNIQNYGTISTGPSGNIRVLGSDVDLSGGSLIITPLGGSSPFSRLIRGSFFVSETNFISESGVYDVSWGIDVNTNTDPSQILLTINPTEILSPFYRSTNSIGLSCINNLLLTNASTWVRTTTINETNVNIQVVAVQTADPNISTDVRFSSTVFPIGTPQQGGLLTPMVELSSPSVDLITGDAFTNTLYVIDQIGSSTNDNLLVNVPAGTFRPAPIILTRFQPPQFLTASPSNDVIFPGIFDNPAYSNLVVTNLYAGYAAKIENTSRRVPQLADVGYTNAPGRVEIKANNLNLAAAKIRGEGLVSIEATNLLDSKDAIIDVAHEDIRLSTTGATPLKLNNLTRSTVQRFAGSLSAYTTIWTNIIASPDTNLGPIELHFTLLMVDASAMSTVQPVQTHQLILNSPSADGQVLIDNPLFVTDRLAINAAGLTLNDSLILGQGLVWSPTNFLRLQNLTNNGFLQLTDLGEFQGINSAPLKTFVNNGTVLAFASLINADYFENNGGIISTQYFRQTFTDTCLGTDFFFTNSLPSIGPININATTAKFENGRLSTSGDITLTGSILKMNKSGTSAGGAVNFNVSSTLTDSGANAANVVEVNDGFNMTAVRPSGDLLGTDFRTSATANSIVNHTWASQDRGATVAGFDNNVAIGMLEIEGATNTIFRFSGSLPGSALYVDQLVIRGQQAMNLSELTNRIVLNGVNLYYGDIQSTNSNFTAETLNGLKLGNGRLIWVTNYSGANSGIDVALSPTGPTVRMNRALRLSTIIDSDNDGIPNAYDDFPLTPATGLRITSVQVASNSGVGFQFNGAASSKYVVEFTTNIQSGVWQQVNQTIQTGSTGGNITFTDPASTSSGQRFYRVRKVQ